MSEANSSNRFQAFLAIGIALAPVVGALLAACASAYNDAAQPERPWLYPGRLALHQCGRAVVGHVSRGPSHQRGTAGERGVYGAVIKNLRGYTDFRGCFTNYL